MDSYQSEADKGEDRSLPEQGLKERVGWRREGGLLCDDGKAFLY